MGPKSLKRKRANQPEEITFDFTARQEYLTGFHKRKLERARHAQEEAARREKEEKAKARQLVRLGRVIGWI
jgi:ribosomal RNA-processing protein 17